MRAPHCRLGLIISVARCMRDNRQIGKVQDGALTLRLQRVAAVPTIRNRYCWLRCGTNAEAMSSPAPRWERSSLKQKLA